jgi:hypothetical protein
MNLRVINKVHFADVRWTHLAQLYPETIRCPLCWQDFKGATGIKNHFAMRPGCPESPRKPLKDKKPAKLFRFKE